MIEKTVLDKGFIELIAHMGDDNTVVSAARVSYLGESKGTEKDAQLIKYLLKNKHTSPFEQVEFQFMVKCPLFVRSQWMRHRTWSYNEVSRRYTSDEIEFHVPSEIRLQSDDNKQMSAGLMENPGLVIDAIKSSALMCYEMYEGMLRLGVAREQARMILPQSMYTKFYAKVDLHNLFHFLELRLHLHAQPEIRLYAQAIEELIKPIVPISYEAWKGVQ